MKIKPGNKPGHWVVVDLCPGCGCPVTKRVAGTEEAVRAAYEKARLWCRICEEQQLGK